MSDIDDVSALRSVTLQLQGTIASLRHELEEAAARGRSDVQAAETRAAAEAKQLRETIDAMRTEMAQSLAKSGFVIEFTGSGDRALQGGVASTGADPSAITQFVAALPDGTVAIAEHNDLAIAQMHGGAWQQCEPLKACLCSVRISCHSGGA